MARCKKQCISHLVISFDVATFCHYLLCYSGNISLGATETSEHTRGQEEEAKELEIQSQKVSKLNSSQVRKIAFNTIAVLKKQRLTTTPFIMGFFPIS